MNKTTRGTLDVLWYLFLFIFFQLASGLLVRIPHVSLSIAMTVSGLLTVALFVWRRYTPMNPAYMQSRPWVVLVWAALLSLGSILPSEWLLETANVDMPEGMEKMMSDVMKQPLGYLAVGILAPLCEEMVFRGAIQRRLQEMLGQRLHWVAIAIVAALFGVLHGNLAQFLHAFVVGLILGWMYYRTGSIVPGLIFHWVNNTVAFVAVRLMPQLENGNLIDLFGGNERSVLLSLLFSLCIFLPSLYQLAIRMKRAERT